MQNCRHQLIEGIYALILGGIFITFFSTTTSFIYQGQSITDSAIFQIIGKYWTKGYLPYRDFFDNKGPYIYTVNAFGFAMTGSKLGIFFIQIINLSIAFFYSLQLFKLYFSVRKSFLLTALTASALTLCTEGGNSVEEYLLPFLFASFYNIEKWLKSNCTKHMYSCSFLYGITISIAFLTRLTDALGIVGGTGIIFLSLYKNKEWKNLYKNTLILILGIILPILPYLVYFREKGILTDYWYATFTFNFDYLKHSGSFSWNTFEIFKWLKSYFNCYILTFTSILILVTTHEKKRGGLWLCASLLPLIWFLGGQRYSHYGIISLPYFNITLIEMYRLNQKFKSDVINFFYFFIAIIPIIGLIYESHSAYKIYGEKETLLIPYQNMVKVIPAQEKKSFIAYNTQPDIYYYLNLKPYYPYFSIQEMGIERSQVLKSKIRKAFLYGNVKWILIEGQNTQIEDILKNRYQLIKTDKKNQLRLYSIKSCTYSGAYPFRNPEA